MPTKDWWIWLVAVFGASPEAMNAVNRARRYCASWIF
jgi:hypothetical protein